MNLILDAIKNPALITHLQGANNYSWLYYQDGKKILLSKPLRYFEQRLPDFIRVHKTALVNPHYVTGFTPPPRNKMQGTIYLVDDLALPVGRRRFNQLKGILMNAVQRTASLAIREATLVQKKPAQWLYIVIADELKAGLIERLLSTLWPNWKFRFFTTGIGLLKVLAKDLDTDLPAMILLHIRSESDPALGALQSIKNNDRLRLIPVLLLTDLENHALAETAYSLGANSVIFHSVNFANSIQSLEKVFRYWLSTASAPNAVCR
jgi:CheY-like chemotaxis protein